MPLLAFPGPAILVPRIIGLYFLKVNRADLPEKICDYCQRRRSELKAIFLESNLIYT